MAFPEGRWKPVVGSVALNAFIADLQGGGAVPATGPREG